MNTRSISPRFHPEIVKLGAEQIDKIHSAPAGSPPRTAAGAPAWLSITCAPMKWNHWLAIVAGFLPLSLFAVVLFLTVYAWPAIKFNGMGFLASDVWNLGNLFARSRSVMAECLVQPGARYGILLLVVGTLLTTAMAIALTVPAGVGAAILLV